MPSIAIITRTKNRPLLLQRASNSIASQNFKNYYWVVVNDGGDNEIASEVINACDVDRERIIFITNDATLGMEAASNIGIRSVKSDYIVIHDDDDTWNPDFLNKTIDFLESSNGKRYGGVITHSYFISEEIQDNEIIEHDRRAYNDRIRSVQLIEMAAHNIYPPIAFVYRRVMWEKIGGYNENLPVLGDWYFNLEFLFHTDIGVIPEILSNYHHRDRDDNQPDIYTNSVIASIDKHEEYNAIIRNELIRRNTEHNPIALAIIQGYAINEFRVNRNKNNEIINSASANNLLDNAENYWLAAEVNYAIANSNVWPRSRKWIKKNMVKPDADLDTILKIIQKWKIHVNAPPDFDEKLYLKKNPDVALAIDSGKIDNGYIHYLKYGRKEGRKRPHKKSDAYQENSNKE